MKEMITISNKMHLSAEEKSQVSKLWNEEYPKSLNFINENGIEIILDKSIQGKGYGSLILKTLKKGETLLNAWVIDNNTSPKANGEFYKSPLSFYLQHKFKVHAEIRLETEKMSGVKISWEK